MEKIPFSATIVLFVSLVTSYFWLSQGRLFIPIKTMQAIAFSTQSLHNFLSFIFVHTGPAHLIVNLVSLAGFGVIVEKKLYPRDIFGIFFLSSTIAGIVFILLNPKTMLLGASAGISGLIAAGVILRPKQAIALGIGIALLSTAAVFVTEGNIQGLLEQKKKEVVIAVEEREKAIEAKLPEKAGELSKTIETKNMEISNMEQGIVIQKLTPTDTVAHAVGAIAGIAYLIAFRRNNFVEAVENYRAIFSKMGAKK